MKSLRDSLSLWSSKGAAPSLGPLPRPGVGSLPHHQEQRLAHLWSDMLKSEQGCRDIESGVRQYSEQATSLHQIEEKMAYKMAEMRAIGTQQSDVAVDAMNILLPEVGTCLPECVSRLETEVLGPVRDYHALYTHIDALRLKRDGLLAEVDRLTDKMEKLRLKGKRSTDILVEKERTQRHLLEVQQQLLQEGASYHALRADYLQHALHCVVDIKFMQYGSEAALYKQHVVGTDAHRTSTAQLADSTARHLKVLNGLNITGV